MKKLNIGCGAKKIKGYDGLDIDDFGQKYVCNIFDFLGQGEYLMPKLDNMFDEVFAEHFLEHFDQDELKIIFHGVYDILKKGGIFKIIVPHKDKTKSWSLTHKTFFTVDTFSVFEDKIFSREFGVEGKWKVLEARTNNRMDIYCEMKKL